MGVHPEDVIDEELIAASDVEVTPGSAQVVVVVDRSQRAGARPDHVEGLVEDDRRSRLVVEIGPERVAKGDTRAAAAGERIATGRGAVAGAALAADVDRLTPRSARVAE